MVNIGVLTSSRADFGVYLPLLRGFQQDDGISFEIIAFGAHLSQFHGYTLNEIKNHGFDVNHSLITLTTNDSPEGISTSFAICAMKFASFWKDYSMDYDLVLCLGDRFEMAAAVFAGIPFGLKFAHFYGGDYSKGAIDNVYRNALTHASSLHFVSTGKCAQKVSELTGSKENIEVIGILSLDDILRRETLSIKEFYDQWKIDLSIPTLLVTFHPETVHPENNISHLNIIKEALSLLQADFQIVVTMPNADTFGSEYRKMYVSLKSNFPEKIFLIENFGVDSYFSCMKHSVLMLGNTSSGISESASFNKYFINCGDRQTGRTMGPNIISVSFDREEMIPAIYETLKLGPFIGKNLYHLPGSVHTIISRIKYFNE